MNDLLTFILRVLGICSGYDATDALWWRTDHEYSPVKFFVNCNDLFYWATADAEEITPNTVDAFEQAFKDCKEKEPVIGSVYAGSLYCCRVRQMRPQGACYKSFPKELWPLFDACGPIRETDKLAFGNPHKQPELTGVS